MREGQTQFPYVLVTASPEVIAKASEISVNGIDEARGIITFVAELRFDEVMRALSGAGGEVGLIQAENYQHSNAKGDLARAFSHLG